jgi:hypothetical protein
MKTGDPTGSNKDDSGLDKAATALEKGKNSEIEKIVTPKSLGTVVPHGVQE